MASRKRRKKQNIPNILKNKPFVISLAVAFIALVIYVFIQNENSTNYKNTLEIGEVGAQVKHQAKTKMGSVYIINNIV